jgi:hypothetical protein
VRGLTAGVVLLLLAACGSASPGGSGSRDPRDTRDPSWRDSGSSRDNFAPPRDIVREPHKDVKDHKGK